MHLGNKIKVTDLDFDTIKNNLKEYLKSQNEFSDYNFEGSSLNILLDILAYNTHYNAYYVNMVANESFLDSASLRNSVVSHAKTLGYTPRSKSAAKSVINLKVVSNNTTPETLNLARGTTFRSNLLDNQSLSFVILNDVSVAKVGTDFNFRDLELYEGKLVNYIYTHDSINNPKGIFEIPDVNVDTNTLKVTVQSSSTNVYTQIYTLASNVLDVDENSAVYFLQQNLYGKYEIYFGNGSIGKSIVDGSVVTINYLVTNGPLGNDISKFTMATPLGYSQYLITVKTVSGGGSDAESIDSIKNNAINNYISQNRLVTTKDYESYILANYPVVDSISVWGGEEEIPPVYGTVFVSLKPKDNYYISTSEKQRIIDEIIKPKSTITTNIKIKDPEYLYLKLYNTVKYEKNKTNYTEEQLRTLIKNALYSYNDIYLNKFDSTFVLSKSQDYVDAVDTNAIIGSNTLLRLEKRFEPTLNVSKSYEIYFNVPLYRGSTLKRLISSEFVSLDAYGIARNTTIEEVPESYTGISEIRITNPGYNYKTSPIVTISGDGYGATATAKIVNGKIDSITIINRGINYTKATISFSGGDGFGAEATAILNASYGTLRTIYFNENAERQIINPNAGTIDYITGKIVIFDINIMSVNTLNNLMSLTVQSEEGIVTSVRNTILVIDKSDPTSILTDFKII